MENLTLKVESGTVTARSIDDVTITFEIVTKSGRVYRDIQQKIARACSDLSLNVKSHDFNNENGYIVIENKGDVTKTFKLFRMSENVFESLVFKVLSVKEKVKTRFFGLNI